MRSIYTLLLLVLFSNILSAQFKDWYLSGGIGYTAMSIETGQLVEYNINGDRVSRFAEEVLLHSYSGFANLSLFYRTEGRFSIRVGVNFGTHTQTDYTGQWRNYSYNGKNNVINLERKRTTDWLWTEAILLYQLLQYKDYPFRVDVGLGVVGMYSAQSYLYGQVYNLEIQEFDKTIQRKDRLRRWGIPVEIRFGLPFYQRGEAGISMQINSLPNSADQASIRLFAAWRLNR